MATLQLKSYSNRLVTVKLSATRWSATLTRILDYYIGDDYDTEIPLPYVNHDPLQQACKWMEHYDMVVKFSSEGIYIVSEWDDKFFNKRTSALAELVKAAIYLGIEELYHSLCNRVPAIVEKVPPSKL